MYTILSVGGSIIIPATGFDPRFLRRFRSFIIAEVKKGRRFIFVTGGGATCRDYQQAAKRVTPLTDTDLDWLGIAVTRLNAEFVRRLFGRYAHAEVIADPTKRVTARKPILVACGFAPGSSSDRDAVLLAKTYGAKALYNLSNIDYVYTADPKKNPRAKKILRCTWSEFRPLVGDKWKPGANTPFDPAATRLAQRFGLTVGFVRGTNLVEVKKALSGKPFKGTIVTP